MIASLVKEVCQIMAASFLSQLCLCCFHFPRLSGKPACTILVSAAQGQLNSTVAHHNEILLLPSE